MEEIISSQELLQFLEETATETVEAFNQDYGTDVELDENKEEYILGFAVITLFGYTGLQKRNDINQEVKRLLLARFPKDYKGIQSTTAEDLAELTKRLGRSPLAQELNSFRRERVKEILDQAYYSTKNELLAIIAEESGKPYVGAVTIGDSRVRPEHADNNKKYWRASTMQPWNDYNCRCTYIYFATQTEAERQGFSPL